MANFALSYGSQKTRLATMVAGVPLIAPKMGLYKNDLVPAPTNVLADFTEADFTGYAQQSPTFGAVVIDPSGLPVAPANAQFTQTGVVITELVYGCFLVDSTGALVGAARFPTPISFNAIGNFVIVNLLMGLGLATVTNAVGP